MYSSPIKQAHNQRNCIIKLKQENNSVIRIVGSVDLERFKYINKYG